LVRKSDFTPQSYQPFQDGQDVVFHRDNSHFERTGWILYRERRIYSPGQKTAGRSSGRIKAATEDRRSQLGSAQGRHYFKMRSAGSSGKHPDTSPEKGPLTAAPASIAGEFGFVVKSKLA